MVILNLLSDCLTTGLSLLVIVLILDSFAYHSSAIVA